MNPLLALALVAAAGIAATRLPRFPARRLPHVDLVAAAGAPLVLVGLLLGPGIGVLDRPVLRALAPVTALAIGWIGAVLGAQFEWRLVRRIPIRAWTLALLEALAAFGVVAIAVVLMRRAIPALAATWTPAAPAVLTLGAVAAVSGPGAVALVAQAVGVRRSLAHALGLAAILDTVLGALAFVLALAVYHPHGGGLGAVRWLLLALASGAGIGMLQVWLSRLRPQGEDLGVILLGTALFGAGVGYGASVSPLLICAVAAGITVNLSPPPQRRRIQALLHDWEHPIYAVFLIIAGALLRLPSAWVLVAVPVLVALRVAAKWAAVRVARAPLGLTDLPPHLGLATVAQGGVALALGINFFLVYGGQGTGPGGAMVTTVVLAMAVAQLAAPPLMNLAFRPAPDREAVAPPAPAQTVEAR